MYVRKSQRYMYVKMRGHSIDIKQPVAKYCA